MSCGCTSCDGTCDTCSESYRNERRLDDLYEEIDANGAEIARRAGKTSYVELSLDECCEYLAQIRAEEDAYEAGAGPYAVPLDELELPF